MEARTVVLDVAERLLVLLHELLNVIVLAFLDLDDFRLARVGARRALFRLGPWGGGAWAAPCDVARARRAAVASSSRTWQQTARGLQAVPGRTWAVRSLQLQLLHLALVLLPQLRDVFVILLEPALGG